MELPKAGVQPVILAQQKLRQGRVDRQEYPMFPVAGS